MTWHWLMPIQDWASSSEMASTEYCVSRTLARFTAGSALDSRQRTCIADPEHQCRFDHRPWQVSEGQPISIKDACVSLAALKMAQGLGSWVAGSRHTSSLNRHITHVNEAAC